MRTIGMIAVLLLVPFMLPAQQGADATTIYFWGGADFLHAHASGSTTNPLTRTVASASSGGYGAGFGLRFYLNEKAAIGLETGYLITETIAQSFPAAAYNEGILPILFTGQYRIVGMQGRSGMSIQGGVGLGILYRTVAQDTYFGSETSVQNSGTGFLGFAGPQAEIDVTHWLAFEAFVRYYVTSVDNSSGKSMLYGGIGAALTF